MCRWPARHDLRLRVAPLSRRAAIPPPLALECGFASDVRALHTSRDKPKAMLPTLLPKQRTKMAVAVAVGLLYTLFLIYFSIVMARDWSRKDPLTIASWALYGLLGDSSVFAIGPVSVMIATNCSRDGLENMAPAAAAVCCGLVCAVIYPGLATSDAVWGAVCVSTLVKALLIAVGFFMIPAYRTPAQKMEMERLRAEGAVPAELQALMQLEERMKDLRRDV